MTQHSRRAFLVTVSAFGLSACGGLVGPPDAGQIYVLNPAPPPANATPKANWALAIVRPDAAGGLGGERIALIQSDATMDYFAAAQYPDSLPAIVQGALVSGFESRVAQVSREQDALHADYDLFVMVKNFEAHYSAPDAIPGVLVTLEVRLATAHGRHIISTFTASQTGNAAANSAGAVTQALAQALASAVQAIVVWAVSAVPATPPTP